MKKPYIIRYGNIYIQTTFKGKRYRFSAGLKATKENLAFVSKNFLEIIADYEAKQLGFKKQRQSNQAIKDESSKTLAFYLEQILKESTLSKTTTLKAYQCRTKDILEFFREIPLAQITREEINGFFDYLLQKGQGQSAISTKTSLLKRALDLAILDGAIVKNPVFHLRGLSNLPKRYKEPFTLEEVEKILQASLKYPRFFTNYLQVAFFSGMREGEILALKLCDIDFEREKISVEKTINHTGITPPKTKSSVRKVDLLKPAKLALLSQKQITESEFVFLKSQKHYGKFLGELYQMWKEVLCECGLKYRSIYNTRHTFASIMLSRGEDIAWISRIMLGHKNISITFDSYVGYIPIKEKHAKFLEGFMSDPLEPHTEEEFLEFGKKNLCNGNVS